MARHEGEILRLAVLDWGIGGFGLVSELMRRSLCCEVVYCSDSGFTPYGLVSAAVLRRRIALWTRFAQNEGATHLVIACNAASSVLPSPSGAQWSRLPSFAVPVTGIIAHGLSAVLEASLRHVGVMGGARTVRSGTYARPLRERGVTVRQRIAQPLSALVERAQLQGDEVLSSVARIVRPLGSCDGVLLGCTHYPALQPVLERALPGTRWIDPVTHLANWLQGQFSLPRGETSVDAWTTGRVGDLSIGAQAAFGVRVHAQHLAALERFGDL